MGGNDVNAHELVLSEGKEEMYSTYFAGSEGAESNAKPLLQPTILGHDEIMRDILLLKGPVTSGTPSSSSNSSSSSRSRGINDKGDADPVDSVDLLDHDDIMDDLLVLKCPRGLVSPETADGGAEKEDDTDRPLRCVPPVVLHDEEVSNDLILLNRWIQGGDQEEIAQKGRGPSPDGNEILRCSRRSALNALFAAGAHLGVRYGDKDCSVLDMAAVEGFVGVIGAILQLGGDVDAATSDGRMAIHCASYCNQADAVDFLAKAGGSVQGRDGLGWTPLHAASVNGSSDAVIALLRHKADTSILDKRKLSPLHLAAEHGHLAAATALMDAGANVTLRCGDDEYSVLDLAAAGGHWEVLSAVISHGADVNAADSDGVTPLYIAALNNHVHAINVLVRAGANLEAKESRGWTALHAASEAGSTHAAVTLLTHGADKDSFTYGTHRPLHLAAEQGHVATVEALLDAGANHSLRITSPYDNYSALDVAASCGHLGVLRALISHGTDAKGVDFDKTTALHAAARSDEVDAINLLVEVGADVNAQDCLGRTPLHTAVVAASCTAISTLLKHRADTNALDRIGRTPLYYAVDCCCLPVVKVLLAGGADTTTRCVFANYSYTPLDKAVAEESLDIVRLLIQFGANVDGADSDGLTPLHVAADRDRAKAIRVLVEAGASVESEDSGGCTPLHHAAANDSRAAILALAGHGADTKKMNLDDRPPLHVAVSRGHLGAVSALIAAGADLELRGGANESSALDAAAHAGHVAILAALIHCGADVNAADSEGRTALITAVASNQAESVDVLAAAGANVEALVNNNTWTSLHAAAEYLYPEVVHMLLKHGANVNAKDVDNENDTPLHVAARQAGMEGSAEIVEALLARDADEAATNDLQQTPADVAHLYAHTNADGEEEDIQPVIGLLARAPGNRAWRRRGLLVLCYARCKRETWEKKIAHAFAEGLAWYTVPRSHARPASADAVEGGEGCDKMGVVIAGRGVKGRVATKAPGYSPEFDRVVAAWLLDLQEEGLFRTIVGFL